jgi:selenocysteine lyase/cysteine desulfurase
VDFDVDLARRDTPGAEKVAHLNNAGVALPPVQVTDAVIAHLRRESEMGGYEAAEAAREQVQRTYSAIAELVGAQPDEIAVVENATRAWDMAFYGMTFAAGDRILTARAEYASNVIAFLQVAARTGAVVEVIDDDESGQVSILDLRRRLNAGTGPVKLVAITHVPTQGGLVNPAEEIGAAAREAGVPFLLDACQSVGQMPVDVERIGCDMLTATGRKFLRAPRGTGFLYVRREFIDQIEPPFLDLHAATWTTPDRYEIRPDARRFENWETNYAEQDRTRRRRGLRAGVGHGVDPGPHHRPRRPPARTALEPGRGRRPRPRVAPLWHRHLHHRWRTSRGHRAPASRERRQRQRLARGVRPPRLAAPRPARPGPRIRALLQHRRRAGTAHQRATAAEVRVPHDGFSQGRV